MTGVLTNSGGVIQTGDGLRVEEHYTVEVTGNARARPYAALTAPGIPPYNTAHPVVPGVRLVEKYAEALQGQADHMRVRCVYRSDTAEDSAPGGGGRYGRPSLQISASVAEEETRQDIDGEYMSVNFQGAYTRLVWVANELVERTQNVSRAFANRAAQVSRPQMVLRVKRWERDNPLSVAKSLTGSVNETSWEGFDDHTLLCSGVDVSEEEDARWRVTYIFRYNPDGWRFRAEIDLGYGANPPREAILGNGIELYNVYPTYRYQRLNMRLPL